MASLYPAVYIYVDVIPGNFDESDDAKLLKTNVLHDNQGFDLRRFIYFNLSDITRLSTLEKQCPCTKSFSGNHPRCICLLFSQIACKESGVRKALFLLTMAYF